MLESIARRAMFRFEFPLRYLAKTPTIDGSMRKWSAEYMLPALVEIEDEAAFADVYAAWNEDYLFAAFDVPGRRRRLEGDPAAWWKKDGIRLCVDTRDARDNKRATRFCHLYYFLPTGGGTSGKRPVVGLHRMSRAKEPPPAVDVSQVKIAVQSDRGGYSVEVAIPAACLNGWDPAEHPRLGLFYKVRDMELGDQHFSVDDELGWNVDPSTWATAVLTR